MRSVKPVTRPEDVSRGSQRESRREDKDAPPTHKLTTEDPELADRFNRVLGETVTAMEESGVKYLFIGGIASGGRGRPRSTHDIDLFVMQDEAELALRALAKHGFQIEKTDPSWLYKGWKENILVDVIFKSKGEIYLDSEMYRRGGFAEFHGKSLRLVAPEDLLIIKAVAHSELNPGHWHDATALLSHATMDWDYLIGRARRAPRRVLSLFLYAQSNDIWVPNWVIHELYAGIFGDHPRRDPAGSRVSTTSGGMRPVGPGLGQNTAPTLATSISRDDRPGSSGIQQSCCYAVAHLRECLAEDARTNELDIELEQSGDRLLLRGEVTGPERREAVEQLARECFPTFRIENQIRLMSFHEPGETEEFS